MHTQKPILNHVLKNSIQYADGEGVNSSGKMPRHILIIAHDPVDCANFEVRVEMDELRQLFADDPKKLLGGHKNQLTLALVRMLRFAYTSKVERDVCKAQDHVDKVIAALDPDNRRIVRKRLADAKVANARAKDLLEMMKMNGGPARIKTAGMRLDDSAVELEAATAAWKYVDEVGKVEDLRQARKVLDEALEKEREYNRKGRKNTNALAGDLEKVLLLTPGIKMNRTQRRRIRKKAITRLRACGAYPSTPRPKPPPRHRQHRVYCETRKLRGWAGRFSIQFFVYPKRQHNFYISAYEARGSKSYQLKVGKWEAMKLVQEEVWVWPEQPTKPNCWDVETVERVCKALIGKLFIRTWGRLQ